MLGILFSFQFGKKVNVSIHNRFHPPIDSVPADRYRPACPLPAGRGYLQCAPALAGNQPAISLKGEVSNHKENFDEILPVTDTLLTPPQNSEPHGALTAGTPCVGYTLPHNI
ncbi:MAG: hypothetical protein LBQ51_02445 [Desulfovibrio sp.]|jgi:hypothetical protein|nr:hypothetical protein [Desulfovibrio sp.]